jgi:crossover junction endodeoxyribonuclease RuvC
MNVSSRPAAGKNHAVAAVPRTKVNPTLERKAFVTSRLADFASKEGLTRQAIRRWPDKAALFARVKDHGRAEACLIALAGLLREGPRV